MATGKPKLFWDTCVYIALITGQPRNQDETKKLYEVEQFVINGQATVFSSAVTLAEVLELHLTPDQSEKFQKFVRNKESPFLPIDARVAMLARDIRDFYHRQGIKVKVPDALQLAAAIYYDADVLHTYDGCGKSYKLTDMLRLPQPIVVGTQSYNIDIQIPQIPGGGALRRPSAEMPILAAGDVEQPRLLLGAAEDSSENTKG